MPCRTPVAEVTGYKGYDLNTDHAHGYGRDESTTATGNCATSAGRSNDSRRPEPSRSTWNRLPSPPTGSASGFPTGRALRVRQAIARELKLPGMAERLLPNPGEPAPEIGILALQKLAAMPSEKLIHASSEASTDLVPVEPASCRSEAFHAFGRRRSDSSVPTTATR